MRLEFDIDSEVYPELHAALSALKSPRARAERLRQLAAAGLVWEKVRLHGAAATAAASPAAASPAAEAPAPQVRSEVVVQPDVVPPPRAPRRSARPSRRDVEQVIRELPVLMDVVADVSPLPVAHDDDPAEEPTLWAAMSAYPDDDGTGELPDASLHVTALSHKPATRSRLMRMKERGLFKNG